ncbi:retrovirus-related pol polyprotein from transposon TNT 1-94 [Tanacetum coccineum]
MDQDSAHMVAASKVPMLKYGEYEIWKMRIEQYIQMIDYSLWKVIENGATLPKTKIMKGVMTEMPITTAEEKAQRRLEVKARSTLMMGIPNEHQLKFNSIKDAKKLLEAVEKRFVGAIVEKLSQEDVNQKLLRSLSPEWNIHTVVWRNKDDLDTMSMDDLYNNLKCPLHGVSTASDSTNAANSTNIDNLSDAGVKCYNCHERGHFARECRAPRNQDNKNKESLRKSMLVETSTSTALVSCDGFGGYDWSDQAKEGPNYALMTFSSSSPDSKPVVENSKAMSSEEEPKVVRKCDDALSIEEWVSDDEEEDVSQPKIKKKIVRPSIVKKEFVKSKQQEKTARKTVKQVEQHRQNTHSPRGNQRNWNNMMSQKLGSNFEMFNKACYVCGSFDHLQVDCNYHQKQFQNQRMVKPVWNNAQMVNHQNFAKKYCPSQFKRTSVFQDVLTNEDPFLVSINTARQNISKIAVLVNTARQANTAHSKTIVNAAITMSYLSKTTHSTIQVSDGLVPKETDFLSNVARQFHIWILQDQGSNLIVISRHMTGNMSYLTDYEEIDGGYVAFYREPQRGKSQENVPLKLNSVLFNDTECIVLSPNFKLIDESQVLLRVPRKNNMYSVDLKNIVPKGGLTCLFAKATSDESKLWHRRLGHLNFKTMNKLVKGNLVRGLPSKLFENDQTCVACQKGKQHRASCKSKTENSISLPLHLLHMDLFGPTFVKSLMKKMYCLVVTDDYSRFTWVFFLATKDETSGILKSFITGIENLVDHKVKVIRCDNGTEFKNREMNQFCEMKGILRQFSVARTPQQNGVAERRNRTLIEAARTMLADSKLPTTFWAEAVNTACYVQNRVLVVKPHNKTPYELFHGRTPTLSFMRPFGCPVTILNTIDHLGKFDGKADEGFFVGYSLNSKAFRVFNSRTRIVEENLHIRFSKSTPNVIGSGPDWLFDIDALTRTMNYEPIVAGTQSNGFAGTKASDNAGQARKETNAVKYYILLPLWTADPPYSQDPKSSHDDGKKVVEDPRKESKCNDQEEEYNVNNTNNVNADGTNEVNAVGGKISIELPFDLNMHALEYYNIFVFSRDDEDDVIGDFQSATQTKKMSKNLEEHGKNPKGNSCIEGSKLDRGYAGKASTIQVAQGYTQEEGIDYDEVFATVARIEAIRLFLAYASFKDFMVYQIDVKVLFSMGRLKNRSPRAWYETLSTYMLDNEFQRGKFEKNLFIKRHKGDVLLMSTMGELTFFLGLQVKEKNDGIFISQDKYVAEILKKFKFIEVNTASTLMETQKPLLKDEDGKEIDVYFYRSMIGSLMYLRSSRPDIMFVVCACARYQVNPKVSHLHAVKRIFRYLKGQPKLGLWYPKDSSFDLVAYTYSDYAGASLDRKSIIRGKAKKSVRLMIGMLFGMELKLMLFWSSVKVKTINGETQLHARVDGKKIIIIESSVRRNLQLADENGIDCLPNYTIFEQLALMGPKTVAWNEFSSTMASAIIC